MTVMLFEHARVAMAHREWDIAHGEPARIGMGQAVEIYGRIGS